MLQYFALTLLSFQLYRTSKYTMGKSKSSKVVKSEKVAEVRTISFVEEGINTKFSQGPKAKSQEATKVATGKVGNATKQGKSALKAAKGPSPQSSSDEDMDEEVSSSDSDKSDSEAEVAKPTMKVNGKINSKTNGTSAGPAKDDSASSDSSESSDGEGVPTSAAPAAAAKDASDGSDDDDDDDDEDSDDSDESESNTNVKPKGPVDATALNGALQKVASKEARIPRQRNDESIG